MQQQTTGEVANLITRLWGGRIISVCNSERIIKIGQYLRKLYSYEKGPVFFWLTVYRDWVVCVCDVVKRAPASSCWRSVVATRLQQWSWWLQPTDVVSSQLRSHQLSRAAHHSRPTATRMKDVSVVLGDIHILRHHRGGRGVASLMTTDDKGEGGIDRTDDVIKTVIL